MAEPWEYWPQAQKIQRKQKAPDILQDLIKNTNLDTNTINDLVKSYVNEGTTKLPNMMQEGTQGPLNQGQMRETPTNSLRPPSYVYDETSDRFSRAPEGVDDLTKQIMKVNNPPRSSSSTAPRGNWYMDENGEWKRYVPGPNESSGRPTGAQEKERLAIESALAQLKNKKAVVKIGGMQDFEPITTRDEALNVPVGLGLDPGRYPEIQDAISSYPESLPEEPKQPTFWDNLGGVMRGTANAIGQTGSAVGRTVQSAISGGNRQNEVPVQPRKQESTNPEDYLRSIRAKVTPANIEWAKRKLGAE